ncbi:MAG: sodium:solute symporter [Bacteroidales bacterium]|uniref:sodium:solute symporter n=1 Tax=Porphyromonas sp. TaxID=1924944 RepID=UPI00297863B3|nr:sodium:solute symporter [Porphyromonas sp.]MDD7437608.1 sodium:solute symporter [Bacteroidales bacterium]MDY3066658.1 sodium:solute symporter [Porphyromonas sp.]
MSPYLILGLLIGYFVLLFAVSYLSGRKANNAGFFVGNRQNHWLIVAIAMIGSTISGVTFVSVPGMVFGSGFSYLQMVLGFVLGQVFIAFVLLPLFYRLNLFSIYEYLDSRFGISTYKTGAWFFFVSKMLGASVRIFLVVLTMQLLVFEPLGIPFIINALFSVFLVYIYTFFGGVKSIISTDVLKSVSLILSVVLSIYFISKALQLNFGDFTNLVKESDMSRVFFFDDLNDRHFFWKQFLAGVFTMIATNGLDQDMMQRNLSCKSYKESQKNAMLSIAMQLVVITLFLLLGLLLYTYAEQFNITLPAKGDEVFPFLATGGFFPIALGIVFIIGLVAASFSAAGSALTALTTSFTIDILGGKSRGEEELTKLRKQVHILMAFVMATCIYGFNIANNTSVIDAVYILSSYTYGPILGMFAFGMISKRLVRDRLVPVVAILSPILCFILDRNSEAWFGGYRFSYEILILNALFTIIGLTLISKRHEANPTR